MGASPIQPTTMDVSHCDAQLDSFKSLDISDGAARLNRPRKGLFPYPLFALGPSRFSGQRRPKPTRFNLADRVARLDMQVPISTSPRQAARGKRMSIVFHLRGVMQREATSYRASTGCCPTTCLARRGQGLWTRQGHGDTLTSLRQRCQKQKGKEPVAVRIPYLISSHFPTRLIPAACTRV